MMVFDVEEDYPQESERIHQPDATPLDPKAARAEMARRFKDVVERMAEEAKSHEVRDSASNAAAVAMAAQAKAIAKIIEKKRKILIDEPSEYVKAVNAVAKLYTSALAGIEQELKAKISEYQTEQRRINLERQRKAAEQAKALQETIASDGGDPLIVPAIITPPQTITRTESGTAYLRTEWKWVLKDFSKVPDRFKKLNEAEINLCVKAGVRHIEGLEIFEQAQTFIRTAADTMPPYEPF